MKVLYVFHPKYLKLTVSLCIITTTQTFGYQSSRMAISVGVGMGTRTLHNTMQEAHVGRILVVIWGLYPQPLESTSPRLIRLFYKQFI